MNIEHANGLTPEKLDEMDALYARASRLPWAYGENRLYYPDVPGKMENGNLARTMVNNGPVLIQSARDLMAARSQIAELKAKLARIREAV